VEDRKAWRLETKQWRVNFQTFVKPISTKLDRLDERNFIEIEIAIFSDKNFYGRVKNRVEKNDFMKLLSGYVDR